MFSPAKRAWYNLNDEPTDEESAMSEAPTIEAIEITLPEPKLTKGQRETRAFYRLLPELLPQYKGLWVAIHNEQVFDSGPNDIELILRVRARVGNVALHVGLVTEVQPIYRIPRYREVSRVVPRT
jgi:hypothetical protein